MLICPQAEAASNCTPLPGAEQLWSKAEVRFVLVGEMHGTKETPAAFGDLVCSASALKRPVVVGLERPAAEQEMLNRLMKAGNEQELVRGLLSESGWGILDGRSSQAMLSLLLTLRGLKLQNLIADVVAYDDGRTGEPASKREERMAAMLMASASKHTNPVVIALTGNLHASKGRPMQSLSYPLMASLMPQTEVVSLFIADEGGESWTQQSDGCGPHKLRSTHGAKRGIDFPEKPPMAGYDGVLATGLPSSASPPAISDPPAPPACSAKP